MSLKKLKMLKSCLFLKWVVVVLSFMHLVHCQDVGDYDQFDNPAVLPLITQVVYSRLSNLTTVLSRDIGNRASFCVKNPDADWNQAFNFSSNLDFLASCIKKTRGDIQQRICTAAEIKFYFDSFFQSADSATHLKPNKNCNLTAWVSGCEPGWACSVGQNQQVDLQASRNIPARTQDCQACCEGFFCPHGLTCMIPCPLGSYCPLSTLNKSTGTCEPYNYQLPSGRPNHTCGGANIWADVASSKEIFCSAGSYCPTTIHTKDCSSGHYCRMGSTSEKRCFKLTTCDPNATNENMHAYGILLLAALSTLLLIIYNCFDQVLTTRERRLAKKRDAAARNARETAKARQRWKSAKDAAKKRASEFQAQLSRTFSRKKSIQHPEKLKILNQAESRTDEDLYPTSDSSTWNASLPPLAPSKGMKKEPGDLMKMMHEIEDNPDSYEGFDVELRDVKTKEHMSKGKDLSTHSQIFNYAYAQLEKEKALQQENKNLTFSGVVSMATNTEVRKRPLIEVSFKDLTLTLKGKNKHLLRCVTGKIRPGRITAVMGPSGAGKTTFLSALAGKAIECKATGLILINGKNEPIHSYKKIIGFVPQDDIVHGNLTVEENLWFHARCRLSAHLAKADKVLVVERVIDTLGLQTVRDSLVGTVEKRGISGGQRKRVNVGLEMVMEPSLLLLDEPTSGLDSASSQLLLRALRREALEGVNICLVVHQPSYALFRMFDDLVLLAKGGLTVYHGSVKKVEEYSKTVEVVKKTEEVKVESGSSSEMEEGELEPEAACGMEEGQREPDSASVRFEIENGAKESNIGWVDSDSKEVEDGENVTKDVGKEGNEENLSASEGKNDGLHETNELPESENLNAGSGDSGDEKENVVAGEGGKGQEEDLGKGGDFKEEGSNDMVVEKSVCLEEASKEEKVIDLEVKTNEELEVPESNKDQILQENGGDKVNVFETEGLIQNFKDKGKSVAVSPSHIAGAAEDGSMVERETLVTVTWKADDMEGPSTRGFDLFTSSPVRKPEERVEMVANNKAKDEKLELEPLDLSLSLPNVLLPIGASQAPGSPSHGRSGQSLTNTFHTNSDGFTASMSFSGSQSFFHHNPSCSLTQNSMDNFEQSVHSRPIFQGIDQVSQGAWHGQSQNESSRHKEMPLYQKILMNGNGSIHHSQTSLQGVPNGQLAPGQHVRITEGTAKMPNGLERQLSFQKQIDVRSPSNSVGSHDIGSNYSFEKRAMREKHGGGNLYRSSGQKEQELLIGGADFVETIISRIVSDPLHVMGRRFHEMNGQSIQYFKESIREIMLNADKKAQLCAFQNALQCRSDMTIEVLLKCHRAQLEILVALKTGLPEYLQLDSGITPADLAEIFLNLRCRNLTCRSPLPVDECDCKVCAKKNGFCSACMCLLCSKFDMASNTCSWVGCDVCLHWCHADCGLRESYIRNGRSATGDQGLTEMQFHCVACDHPSEMFGFVKEVFQHFAKEWSAERMSKELEYVKRIFSASKDVRGRRLHEIADQMLVRLSNKSDLPEVLNYIVSFLTDSESSKFASTGIAGPSHDASWLKSVYSDKPPQLEGSATLLPSFHVDRNDKCTLDLELRKGAEKEPLFDELESIVRIKLAEAKMFQARADDARRDAEGLKRIAIAKNEKIEEEYTSRITKLRLVEAEEARKQKLEEFQALDRAYREYTSMKMRMEDDIKDLLLKMEATRRNLAM